MGTDSRRLLSAGPAAPRSLAAGCALLLLALLGAAPAAAQERPPADTIAPADSLPPDTLARTLPDTAAAAADTLVYVPLVDFPPPADSGWVAGVWSWDLQRLLAEGAFDLVDLLERLPAVHPVRGGLYGAPQALSAFGSAGGRLDVYLDGFALEPLHATIEDLARIPLASLSAVRIERRLDGVRIDLTTLQPFAADPYSRVDAGTGDYDLEAFRGVFLTPAFLGGPLGLAVERLEGTQRNRAQESDTFNGWLKWGLVSSSGNRGFNVEYRRTTLNRDRDMPVPLTGRRDDLLLRARGRFGPALTAEAFAGRSWLDDERRPPASAEEGDTVRLEREATQIGARAALDRGRISARGAARYLDGPGLPAFIAEADAGASVLPRLRLGLRTRWESWSGTGGLVTAAARADARALSWLHGFVEATTGERGTRLLADSFPEAHTTGRTGLRGGAEIRRGRLALGAAALTLDAERAASFGLDFDEPARLYPGGDLRGFELHAALPLFGTGFGVEGWLLDWTGDPWIYMPGPSWRAGLTYHDTPLRDNPNLEVLARLEAYERGAMLVPRTSTFGSSVERVPARQQLDFYIQARIVDVRVFIRWRNITHLLERFDVPERTLPGQRVNFGVFWEFWN